MKAILLAGAILTLSSCASAPKYETVWYDQDGFTVSRDTDPEFKRKGDFCLAMANSLKASVAHNPYQAYRGGGSFNAFNHAMSVRMQQGQATRTIRNNALVDCMFKQGYVKQRIALSQ